MIGLCRCVIRKAKIDFGQGTLIHNLCYSSLLHQR